jgi:DNA-binding transcriptional LysR family regulator
MTIDIDTGLLRGFLVSARLGSISRAALELGRTQPALSQQLRRLEDILGETVLERRTNGVVLTAAGSALLPYAERILALSGEALAGPPRGRLAGRCRIGVLEDFTGNALPAAFADFGRLHSETTLELVSLNGRDTRDALDQGRVELALCEAEYLDPPLRWSTRLPLLWAASESFDTTLDPLPLLMFSEPCRWRFLIQAALGAAGRRWRIAFESDSLTALSAAARAGLGITALLPVTMGYGIVTPVLSPPLPALPEIEIGLARRPDSEGNPLTDAMEALLKQLL